MASDQSLKFGWGDPVKLKKSVMDLYEIRTGSICGFRKIDNEEVAKKLNVPLGTILVLVESCDGKSIEIPENNLEILK